MGEHDRGAFGQLMKQAKAKGARTLRFFCWLDRGDEMRRWEARTWIKGIGSPLVQRGRTGEEALRKLVEALP